MICAFYQFLCILNVLHLPICNNFTPYFSFDLFYMNNKVFLILGLLCCIYATVTFTSGCAQIGAPTGGPRDTLVPILLKANPEKDKLNFTGNKITLSFNEYIEIDNLQENLLVSPSPKNNPVINSNLKTITIKLKDTLRPNTTYSINFGNAIKDINEGNVLKNYTYTFSTGNHIDSLTLEGKVQMAETGKIDSTLLVFLYKDAPDSAVQNRKPDYISRVNGEGRFSFSHLPAASFKIYALKDGDGGKTYNAKTEPFAFYDNDINTASVNAPVNLFAFAEKKPEAKTQDAAKSSADKKKGAAEKKLRYTIANGSKKQDLLESFDINFSSPLKKFDSLNIILSDTNYKPIAGTRIRIDSSRTKINILPTWQPETDYRLIVMKDAIADSLGNTLEKTDTIFFQSKKIADYGTVVLRFKNIDLAKHPVLLFLEGESVKATFPVTSTEWSNKMFIPGDYGIRILYDENNNGTWDPGSYTDKKQPEKAISLPQKLSVRADWDNERDIVL